MRSSLRLLALFVMIAVLVPHSSRSTVVAQSSGPVLAFGFEEGVGGTAADATGNGHAGTLAGPTWTTSGRFGQALSFDGINDWVTVADAPLLDLTDGMTLEAWVFPTAPGPWRTAVLKESPGGLAYALYALADGAFGNTYINVGGVDRAPAVSTPVPLNQWTYVAATYDGATLRLYVNGVQAGAASVSGTILQSAGALRIGGNSVWSEWFQGRIDEVRVYRRAMPQAEIQRDMNQPVTPSDSTPPSVISTVPASGASNVSLAANVLAVFSEPMSVATISTSTVTLRDSGGAVVPAAVSYNAATSTVTLDPNASLVAVRTYTATVSGGSAGVRDAAGNPLAADVSWTFTTTSDATPPAVVSQSPAPGAVNVGSGIDVTATFSEPIAGHTLSFTLRTQAGVQVPATVTYDDPSRTARLRPSAALAASTAYTASVQAADLVGNGMPAPVTWSFTTGTPGFVESVVFTGLIEPTAIEFASDGRVLVAEKRGVIKVFDSLADTTPTTVADLRASVYNFWDRGLLGMALDPAFPARPYIYLLYTYDAEIGNGTLPRWGAPGVDADPCPNPPGATGDGCIVSGRLTRIELSGNTMIGGERVLVHDWPQQYPSHSVGSLMFGADGALYATGGDGASFNFVDYGQDGNPVNPFGDPPVAVGGIQQPPTAEGGALRSQDLRTNGDPVTLDGTVIRIDPDTGAAMPGNPLSAHPDANGRRIIAHGFRNPFRFTIRPGTNELYVGDVGWSAWEEINRIPDGSDAVVENFGWPCYEGSGRQAGYDSANLNICESLYAEPGAVTAPLLAYPHRAPVLTGDTCANGSSSTSGLAFYTGGAYPAEYDGALFFADYSRDCIWVMFPGAGGLPDPALRTSFRPGAQNPVQLKIGPGGDLFYVDLAGTIRRMQYFDGNAPPTAVILATPTAGNAPLTVTFDGSGSSDPNGDALVYAWDLDGDGAFDDGTTATRTFTYGLAGIYTARLRITDPNGLSDVTSLVITANNAPPVATIDTPAPSLRWRVGQLIAFSGHATDGEDGALPASAMRWELVLQHCSLVGDCHAHPVQSFAGVASGSFTAPDHEYPSHLELVFTATDTSGLSDTERVRLDPMTVDLSFNTQPGGLQLVVGSASAVTPFTRTVILGSSNSISAPSPSAHGEGQVYEFVSWSDGGAATHNIVAGDGGGSFVATYTPVPTIAITNASVTEGPGAAAAFTVSLFQASALTVTVDYTTVNGSAAAGADYVAQSGTLTFPPGTTSRVVSVAVNNDALDEDNELFLVRLSNPAHATIADNEGNGTIVDDDAMPTLGVDDVTVNEGNSGSVMATFVVRLSTPSGRPVTLSFGTANGTAAAGSDYTATSGSLGIPAGSVTATVNVPILGDLIDEADETFVLNVSSVANAVVSDPQGTATIVDDDVPGAAGLVAAWGFEEGSGTTAGDRSGNGVTGAISGAAWSAAGRFGGALSFDGVNDLVTVADRASLDLTTGMTISAWVRPSVLSGWRTVLLKEATGGLAYGVYAHDNAPQPASYVNTGSGDVAATGTAQLAVSAWAHLASTYDGAALRLYVNGNLVRTVTIGGAIVSTSGALRIGGNLIWGEYFGGLIDEVRIYNRAQTAGEIQGDMNRPVVQP